MRRILPLLLLTFLLSCGGSTPNSSYISRHLNSITVQPATNTLTIGSSVTLVATGQFDDGKAENLATDDWGVNWNSDTTQTATVNSSGTATCLASGGPVKLTASAVIGSARAATVRKFPSRSFKGPRLWNANKHNRVDRSSTLYSPPHILRSFGSSSVSYMTCWGGVLNSTTTTSPAGCVFAFCITVA